MNDNYKRNIDYLRLSLTDRCQLKCKYCMPSQVVTFMPNEKLLKLDEIVEMAKVFARLGIRKIKLTGGEPLIHPDIKTIISRLKTIENIEEVTLTTNGILLDSKINELVTAGLDGINISLDTLNPDRYHAMTGQNSLNEVLNGLNNAICSPIRKIKINCVLINSFNADEIIDMARLARDNYVHIRFIELMPIGEKHSLQVVSESYIKEILIQEFGNLSPATDKIGNGPAHYVKIKGFRGKIGFISAISQHFCGECNRVRVTCEGFLKTCLYFSQGVDLKPFLYSSQLEKVILEHLKLKPKEHRFDTKQDENREQRSMIQIGG